MKDEKDTNTTRKALAGRISRIMKSNEWHVGEGTSKVGDETAAGL